jgi:hypothetical protein
MKYIVLTGLMLFLSFAALHDAPAVEKYVTTCRDTSPPHKKNGPDVNSKNKPHAYSVEQIKLVEHMLAALQYNPGEIDGKNDLQLECALTAFQKMNGLERDGRVNPDVLKALKNPVYPVHSKSYKGHHVEADLVRQVIVVYLDDEILRILPTSSGANKPFKEPGGGYGSAKTPLGDFKFFAHILGIHVSHLGDLFNPVYFDKGGYAVHGDTEVPPYNASHGCLRIPIKDSEWFEKTIPLGTPLLVSETALPVYRPE